MQQQQYLYREMYKVLPKNLGPPKNKVVPQLLEISHQSHFLFEALPSPFSGFVFYVLRRAGPQIISPALRASLIEKMPLSNIALIRNVTLFYRTFGHHMRHIKILIFRCAIIAHVKAIYDVGWRAM